MEAKEKLNTLKDKIISSVEIWADSRIDGFVANNPKLKTASIYMKRGAKNYLLKKRGKIGDIIDSAALFICDENGNIDAELLFDDLMTMFRDMEELPFGNGLIRGTIGSGVVRFELPDNPVVKLLFGDTGAIRITESDFKELKELFVENV